MTQTVKQSSSLSAEQWQQVIDQQKTSGMSQRAFCNTHCIGLSTFTHWKRKLQKSPVTTPKEIPEQQEWIELSSQSEATSQAWHIELELPGGVTLRMRQ